MLSLSFTPLQIRVISVIRVIRVMRVTRVISVIRVIKVIMVIRVIMVIMVNTVIKVITPLLAELCWEVLDSMCSAKHSRVIRVRVMWVIKVI